MFTFTHVYKTQIMAISYNNLITKHFHGRIGDVVLRWVAGKTVMSKRPDCSKVVKTPAQLENQKSFARAVKYSKGVKNDPQRSEKYSKNKVKYKSVYHAAMSDCLTKPKVKKVELAGYRGHQGNVIRILAWDKFRVETVSVMIMNKMGQLIEKGPAVARMYSGNREWDYIATTENVDYTGGKVIVLVTDKPGNVVQADVDINGSS
jgi:hypothetical protein